MRVLLLLSVWLTGCVTYVVGPDHVLHPRRDAEAGGAEEPASRIADVHNLRRARRHARMGFFIEGPVVIADREFREPFEEAGRAVGVDGDGLDLPVAKRGRLDQFTLTRGMAGPVRELRRLERTPVVLREAKSQRRRLRVGVLAQKRTEQFEEFRRRNRRRVRAVLALNLGAVIGASVKG